MIMKKISAVLFFLLYHICCGYSQEYLPLGMTDQIIRHTYYTIGYNNTHHGPDWVYYHVESKNINYSIERTNDFRDDPTCLSDAKLSDYRHSGYDRGHMCPAAIMKSNRKAMSESFYMSNMSPQKPNLNRRSWRYLESQVRKWLKKEKELYIITGAIYEDNLGTIGNKVTVPGYYYKIIYDPTGDKKMIGFILKNSNEKQWIQSKVVTVDKIEKETGFDFFPELPDNIEDKLESKSNFHNW